MIYQALMKPLIGATCPPGRLQQDRKPPRGRWSRSSSPASAGVSSVSSGGFVRQVGASSWGSIFPWLSRGVGTLGCQSQRVLHTHKGSTRKRRGKSKSSYCGKGVVFFGLFFPSREKEAVFESLTHALRALTSPAPLGLFFR